MALVLPLALIVAALIALWTVPEHSLLFGLDHGGFARAAFGVAFLLWLLLAGARRAGPGGVARAVSAAAMWAAIIVGLTGVYAYRFEAADIAARVMAELFPGEPQVGRGGEVILTHRLGGQFVVPATVGKAKIAFLFDTGASTVVLRAEDAERIGVDAAGLDFSVDVVTANGAALAAPTRLDRMAIGPIVVRDVRALVARPGALDQSLLGMSFLERLQSYTVERGRLILKAK